jgi:fructose-bisphosphate aldolase class I
MVCPGQDCQVKYSASDIALATVQVLRRTVPAAVPGITFLSGGQSEEEATMNLDEINRVNLLRPWSLTFSYGRALQHTVLKTWQGRSDNVQAAQSALKERAKANSRAATGSYQTGPQKTGNLDASASESIYVKNYSY